MHTGVGFFLKSKVLPEIQIYAMSKVIYMLELLYNLANTNKQIPDKNKI